MKAKVGRVVRTQIDSELLRESGGATDPLRPLTVYLPPEGPAAGELATVIEVILRKHD